MFRSGFATVVGEGSDAHLAAGTAEFLRHSRPLDVNPELPVDQMPLVWRSKHAIYYPFGAVATASGLETWEVLSTFASLLLALGGVGIYLLAREILGASVGVAAVAMTIAGANRMMLHTGMHPYFNQTWGYMTLAVLDRAGLVGGAPLLARRPCAACCCSWPSGRSPIP